MDIFLAWLAPVLTLVVMEGLLSADNALVLAIQARVLKDPIQQKKALLYGLWGAVVARAVFIFLGVWLVKLWFVEVIGALYLLKIVYDHYFSKEEVHDENHNLIDDDYEGTWMHKIFRFIVRRPLAPFISVIISIELMDVSFSADSILAAFAISHNFWVLFAGGVLGIIMMRGVAGVFTKLIARVPEMEQTAFILIAIIAAKMLVGTVHHFAAWFGVEMEKIEISQPVFFGVLVATFLATFIVHWFRKNKHTGHGTNVSA